MFLLKLNFLYQKLKIEQIIQFNYLIIRRNANKEIPFIDSESLNIDIISINLDNKNYDLSFNVFGTQKIKTKKGSYVIESGPTNSNLKKNIIIESGFGKTKTLNAKEKIIKNISINNRI